MYEVVREPFRTVLHARWSVFFDHLQVPYLYEPERFPAPDGAAVTPTFWLPQQRLWFTPADAIPAWWAQFAEAAGPERSHVPDPPVWEMGGPGAGTDFEGSMQVGEEWQAEEVLLCLGGLPDGHALSSDPWVGPHMGMYSCDDYPSHRWTMCPNCGLFGATFWGYAGRLPCGCLDWADRKVDNSTDDRLMAAYRAAAGERLQPCSPTPNGAGWTVVRKVLVGQVGAALARDRCVGACRPMADQLRAELPPDAEVDAAAECLCTECPGYVCSACHERPASAAGASCRTCEPLPMLSVTRARQLLNEHAGTLARHAKRHPREMNTLINQYTNVPRRGEASFGQLGEGLTLAEQWLAAPDLIPETPATRRSLTEDELTALSSVELRRALNQTLVRLSTLTGERIPFLQMHVNSAMGVSNRADADEEQLREGIRQAQSWLADPQAFAEHTTKLGGR